MNLGYKLVEYYNPKIDDYPPMDKLNSVILLVNLALDIPNFNLLEYFLCVLQHPGYFPNWHLSTESPNEVEYSINLANLIASIENRLKEQ